MSLDRFLKAQEKSYAGALAELQAGAKRGHWIWWILPQMRGLGTSEYAVFYGIADKAEAAAYLAHPVLGARYRECVAVIHGHLCEGRVAPLTLMGSEIDVMKLRSSLQLLLSVAPSFDEPFGTQADDLMATLDGSGNVR
jgi:uncharacterized protein (DUF1810 family)